MHSIQADLPFKLGERIIVILKDLPVSQAVNIENVEVNKIYKTGSSPQETQKSTIK